jgi:hypothetical protein
MRRITGAAARDSSRSANSITITALAFGSGTSRSLASRTIPSVPSAHHHFGEIHRLGRAGELVQVVSAHTPQHLRIATLDLRGVFGREAQDHPVTGRFE